MTQNTKRGGEFGGRTGSSPSRLSSDTSKEQRTREQMDSPEPRPSRDSRRISLVCSTCCKEKDTMQQHVVSVFSEIPKPRSHGCGK